MKLYGRIESHVNIRSFYMVTFEKSHFARVFVCHASNFLIMYNEKFYINEYQ